MNTLLLTGQTDLITTGVLEQLSGRFSLVLTTDDKKREEDVGRVYHIRPGTAAFEQLFWSCEFSAVWYFSPACREPLSLRTSQQSDYSMEGPKDLVRKKRVISEADQAEAYFSDLKRVCDQCREAGVKKFILVSSPFLTEEERKSEEELVLSGKDPSLQAAILRVPGLLNGSGEGTWLGDLFEILYHGGRSVTVPVPEGGVLEFLPVEDLARLMTRMTLAPYIGGIYVLSGEYVITISRLREEVSAVSKKTRLVEGKKPAGRSPSEDAGDLADSFCYYNKDQKPLDFQGLYEAFCKKKKEDGHNVFSRVLGIRKKLPNFLVVLADIVVLFFAAEYISRYTSGFVYFESIDVRLIYIFLIATFHGLRAGLVASLAECIVLYYKYQDIGVYSLQLFYIVENWIPFVLYIITGAITGYFSDLRENEKALVERENALLREKYLFLNDMYHITSEVRDEYRTQILTFDNSYGKICKAIDRLEDESPGEVCQRAEEILGDFLNNPSIFIYRAEAGCDAETVLEKDRPGREEREVLSVSRQEEMFKNRDKGIYTNITLSPGLPMFCARLPFPKSEGGEAGCSVEAGPQWEAGNASGAESGANKADGTGECWYIAAWDAMPDQMNDYYANQFEVLCRLIGHALMRACPGQDG